MSFRLSSNDLKDGQRMPEAQVFNGMGYSGGNRSPHLAWDGAPEGTKSFVLTCYDPDAPTGSGWWHWVIVNIPASATSLDKNAGDPKADAAPKGSLQIRTDFGTPGYGGPCPPKGDKPHRYIFTVFAVDGDTLPVDASASAAAVGF